MKTTTPDKCPHGGVRLGDKYICARCSQQDEDALFGLAVLYVARKAAKRTNIHPNTLQDDIGTAAAAMVQYKNKILTAENPTGMAITIATRAIKKSYSRIKGVPDAAVGTWHFEGNSYSGNEGNPAATVPQRLEALEGKLPPYEDTTTIRPYSATALAMRSLEAGDGVPDRRVKMYTSSDANGDRRGLEFPGIHLLWNDRNFDKLINAIQDFADNNPDLWDVIDRRIAFMRSLEETAEGEDNAAHVMGLSWSQIAMELTITERQARYKYSQGCRMMRDHLVRVLLP